MMKFWCGIIAWYKGDDGKYHGGHNPLTFATTMDRAPRFCCMIHLLALNPLLVFLRNKGLITTDGGVIGWRRE